MTQEFQKAIELNNMVTEKLRSVGCIIGKKLVKPITDLPNSEFKSWLIEIIVLRDQAYKAAGIQTKPIK
jgi:hypothetical protein